MAGPAPDEVRGVKAKEKASPDVPVVQGSSDGRPAKFDLKALGNLHASKQPKSKPASTNPFGPEDPPSRPPPRSAERHRQRHVENMQLDGRKVPSRLPGTVYEAGWLVAVVDREGDATLAEAENRDGEVCVVCDRALKSEDGENMCRDCLMMEHD